MCTRFLQFTFRALLIVTGLTIAGVNGLSIAVSGETTNITVSGFVSKVAIIAGKDGSMYQVIKLNSAATYVVASEQAVAEGFEVDLDVSSGTKMAHDEVIADSYPNAIYARSIAIKSFPTVVNGKWFRYFPEGRMVPCVSEGCVKQ